MSAARYIIIVCCWKILSRHWQKPVRGNWKSRLPHSDGTEARRDDLPPGFLASAIQPIDLALVLRRWHRSIGCAPFADGIPLLAVNVVVDT